MQTLDENLKDYLENILSQAQNGIVITDPNKKSNPIIFVNETACKRFEYKKKNFLGNNCRFLQAHDTDQKEVNDLRSAIKKQEPITRVVRNYTKSGKLIYNEVSISPIFDTSKNLKYYLGIQKDVTKEILLQKENEELQNEKLENAQINTIGKLSGGISHEINTPLTVINGNIEMLKQSIKELDDHKHKSNMLEDLADVEFNLNRIKNIAESMREIASTDRFEPRELNLYRALIFSLRLTYHKSKKITKINIQNQPFSLDLERDNQVFTVKADKAKLEQAFMAIIDNALDELEIKGGFEKNILDIKILEHNDKLEVVFQDNAGGVDQELLPEIFKPFKGKKQHRGLGIGLSVVKKIMDEHHFDIKFENADSGAKITVIIRKP